MKRKQQHLTPFQICQMAKQAKKDIDISKGSDLSTWSTWAILSAWYLAKIEKWDKNDLEYYFPILNKYYKEYENNDFFLIINKQKERVLQYIEDEEFLFLDDVIFDKPLVRNGVKKDSFEYYIGKKQMEVNNQYSSQHFRYWLAHYNAMIDIGFSKEDLKDHNYKMEELRTAYYRKQTPSIFQIHDLLKKEIKIDIALPTEEQMRERAAM